MAADESISEQAPHMAKLDLAMDETVRRQACELAHIFDARAQLEDRVTLAPRDEIPRADGAVAHRTQHAGAVIIRDPRLTRARTLSDQTGGAEETVSEPRQHRRSARFPGHWKSCLQRKAITRSTRGEAKPP
jgi:hypothetical protein